ncbi:hypothetical protein SPRG_14600 [Saprolegnia parasitica CBS 223.65]|uniref:Uncharacterized protein n=1 Tax=Saprolegnia parasitica (strain CBS 223.65) TaxID=695850 RepID=A0A067BTH3_SAPPC|nr:hypothetical protein SPRG_14600 [Saprolegnia parasitica CBS 223.65]KDO20120.1 hypothetical protein SPRG_14600 [Saprolegnia parasitica CBS 223.65]|eukprot:XP_012209163.1 hypothetical protein SPRG_14600 [Saprolegnia parasitica CBS 223.65]
MDLPVLPDGPSQSVVVPIKSRLVSRKGAFFQAGVRLVGLAIIGLVATDSILNNWAVNDYLGNAYRFLTPITGMRSVTDLDATYTFMRGASTTDISRIGNWMVNYTMAALATKSNDVYLVWGGVFAMTPAINLCDAFQGEYALPTLTKRRLGLASNTVTFFRGSALTHMFTGDGAVNLANDSMSMGDLNALGYTAGRHLVDLRLTTETNFSNSSTPNSQLLNFFRVSPKSYCTGCNPIAEIGYGTCNITSVYDARRQVLTITTASNLVGADYHLGMMLPHTSFSTASHYVKAIAILFALGGYLASRRTVQWQEANGSDSMVAKLVRMISPKCFPYPSVALRFDMFCYNSDAFVFLFATSVVLDMGNCLLFLRHISAYADPAPRWTHTFQMYALTTRLLWFNCACLKLLKIAWSIVSTATFNGESVLMGYLNWTNVTSLYLSAIVLAYIPTYIDYSNSVTVDVNHEVSNLDTLFVDALDGYYLRTTPAIAIGVLVNVLLVTLLDQLWHRARWRQLAQNSLARQAMFNSSSIVCDYLHGIQVDGDGATILICRARRLSTLQWFFMSHLICFGLPEKQLRLKKRMLQSSATTKDESSAGSEAKCMVLQDSDRNVHLVDSTFSDVTALVYNIKVLKDTTVTIQ